MDIPRLAFDCQFNTKVKRLKSEIKIKFYVQNRGFQPDGAKYMKMVKSCWVKRPSGRGQW
jgi:hypothetical protein